MSKVNAVPVFEGLSYFGLNDERRIVIAVRDGEVDTLWPISGVRETVPMSAMQEFLKGSERRTYLHPKGEIRTKVSDDGETVEYVTPDRERKVVSAKAWAKWRSAIPG